MSHDLRFALRMILSHRWFSLAVVATLALGIGLNTMVFTLVDAAMFKPVPVPGGERLVAIMLQDLAQPDHLSGISHPDFREIRAGASTFESIEASQPEEAVLSERGNPPDAYNLARISPGMFGMLHYQPVLGRGFLASDAAGPAERVVLISYNVWRDRYALSPQILGHAVRVNEQPATIVGVMPENFRFPNHEDLWTPLTPTAELENRTHKALQLFGILKPGTPIEQARADLDAISRRLAADHPDTNKGLGILVQTFHERYNGGNIRLVFLLMLGAVGFVLLIACANVANMMLSRALGRQREMSVRAALGASRWQVIRQLLIESLLLSVLGGALGLGIAWYGVHAFDLASQDVGRPYWVQFSMDYRVFAYFAALCLFTGLLFGLAPALRSSRVDLNVALRDGSRSAGTQHGSALANILVVFQFALTLVLLTGAGLFAHSFLEYQSLNPGVPEDRIMTARVRLPKDHYATEESRRQFFNQLVPRLAALPGATSASIVSGLPGTSTFSQPIEIEGQPVLDAAHRPSASILVQSPGYFANIDLPLLQGRDFNEIDNASAVVTKEFAELHWPHESALGRRFRFYSDEKPGDWMTVVGVAANMVQDADQTAPNPLVFVPYRSRNFESMLLVVHAAANPSALVSPMRAAVQEMDPDLPLFEVRTLHEAVDHSRWFLRVFGSVFLVFAVIALVIASVGIYAVIAQAAARRTQEIGVRMALGATSRDILGMVLLRGCKQLCAGLILGLAAAIPAARLMTKLPFRLSASDPVVFGGVCLLLTTVGLFACWLPARRAAALNPTIAIRYE